MEQESTSLDKSFCKLQSFPLVNRLRYGFFLKIWVARHFFTSLRGTSLASIFASRRALMVIVGSLEGRRSSLRAHIAMYLAHLCDIIFCLPVLGRLKMVEVLLNFRIQLLTIGSGIINLLAMVLYSRPRSLHNRTIFAHNQSRVRDISPFITIKKLNSMCVDKTLQYKKSSEHFEEVWGSGGWPFFAVNNAAKKPCGFCLQSKEIKIKL
jgi:hypothetical protein